MYDQMCVVGLASLSPLFDTFLPAAKRADGIPAAIEFDIAMQAHIHEVCGDVFDVRPLTRAVGHHQGNVVLAQQFHEAIAQEAFVAYFHRMA